MDIFRFPYTDMQGTGCTSSGSDQVADAFDKYIKEEGLEQEVKVVRTGCFGLCEVGPIVVCIGKELFTAGLRKRMYRR